MLSKKMGLKVVSLLTAGVMSLSSASMLKVCAAGEVKGEVAQSSSTESFWTKYKNYVIGGSSAVGVVAAVLAVLFVKKHKATGTKLNEELPKGQDPVVNSTLGADGEEEEKEEEPADGVDDQTPKEEKKPEEKPADE